MNPEVSIVLPTKNRADNLAQCLQSLCAQTHKDFEVVVVDAGSSDATEQVIKRFEKRLKLIVVSASGGLVSQMNEGLRIAVGQLFVRIDDDVVASPRWLESIVDTFTQSSSIGGVTGPTIIPEDRKNARDLFLFQNRFQDGNVFWRFLGTLYYSYFMERQPFAIGKWFKSGAFSLGSNYSGSWTMNHSIEVTHHEACNMAIRTGLLRTSGGFDPIYTGIGEFHEPDASFRIRKMGFKIVFQPAALVYHIPSKGGYFRDRPDSYGRIVNFINFYYRNIRPDNPDKALRFLSYILFLNSYWVYMYLRTQQLSQLGCIKGTIVGLMRNLSFHAPQSSR